eukprot:1124356-Amphidinium_carterae.1
MLQIQTRRAQVALYPVLAEASFRVPGNDQLQGWVHQPPTASFTSEEAARLVEVGSPSSEIDVGRVWALVSDKVSHQVVR